MYVVYLLYTKKILLGFRRTYDITITYKKKIKNTTMNVFQTQLIIFF